MFPDCQKKAQEEIDKLLGQADGSGIERLPLFSDRDHMPYMEAVLTELIRWGCVGPLGIPHSLEQEDVYKGMRIPKNTLVLVNIR